MLPLEARLRNMTYASPLCIDIEMKEFKDGVVSQENVFSQVKIGQVPIMLKSQACPLAKADDSELIEIGECTYDQGGYFIINGSEKVLIGQESMARNTVYVFAKKQSKYSFVSETYQFFKTVLMYTKSHFLSIYVRFFFK